MRIALLGFGLIGGSIARALHAQDPDGWTVVAWSPTGDGPAAGARDGTIARAAATPEEAIEGAGLIVLAAPPLACLAWLDELGGPMRPALDAAAIVTDVASTKRRIVARAAELDLPFVGGHPMAGRETTGYASADAELFVGRPWIVCGAEDAAIGEVETLARATGARTLTMTPDEHDAAVAAVSHLPLVLSAALVETVALGGAGSADAVELAAGGWASMTRLAGGDPEMGAGILATNADLVRDRLGDLQRVIDEWIATLDGATPDAGALERRLEAARNALRRRS